jgi:hypothetical protein
LDIKNIKRSEKWGNKSPKIRSVFMLIFASYWVTNAFHIMYFGSLEVPKLRANSKGEVKGKSSTWNHFESLKVEKLNHAN